MSCYFIFLTEISASIGGFQNQINYCMHSLEVLWVYYIWMVTVLIYMSVIYSSN